MNGRLERLDGCSSWAMAEFSSKADRCDTKCRAKSEVTWAKKSFLTNVIESAGTLWVKEKLECSVRQEIEGAW